MKKWLTKKTPKNTLKYFYKICHFKCSRCSECKRHIITAKHIKLTNVDKKTPKNTLKYFYKICDFKCSNKRDYERHLNTAKHKMVTNSDKKNAKKRV